MMRRSQRVPVSITDRHDEVMDKLYEIRNDIAFIKIMATDTDDCPCGCIHIWD